MLHEAALSPRRPPRIAGGRSSPPAPYGSTEDEQFFDEPGADLRAA